MSAQDYAPTDQELKDAKAKAVSLWLQPNGNIVGIGIGKKVEKGAITPTDCIRVYVVAKFDKDTPPFRKQDLTQDEALPKTVPGFNVNTDVVSVTRFGREVHAPKPGNVDAGQPGSAIRVKTTAPHVDEGFQGTLGAIVRDNEGRSYILSCNHVLAVNGRVFTDPRAKPVVVSAELIGQQFPIAEPDDKGFIQLERDRPNLVDCAVARRLAHKLNPSEYRTVDPRDQNVTNVYKTGAVTRYTEGNIVDRDVDLYIDYSFGTFLFEKQILIDGGDDDVNKAFAVAGDSGSLVSDSKTKQPTAMIFAASGRYAVACAIGDVLAALGSKDRLNKALSIAVAPAGADTKISYSSVL